ARIDKSRCFDVQLRESALTYPTPPVLGPPPRGFTMKRLRSILGAVTVTGALAVCLTVTFSANASVPPTPTGWNLVWSDDFTGSAGSPVNSANWLYDLGTSYPGGAGNWGTGEIETMTNSTANVYQDGGGNLAIKPIRAANGSWTSGR